MNYSSLKQGQDKDSHPLFNLGLKTLTKLLGWGGREIIKEKEERKLSRFANEVKITSQLLETDGACEIQVRHK